MANQRRAAWPGEDLCYSCVYTAMRSRGVCPRCGRHGVLPGLALDGDRQPICRSCGEIPGDFTCRRCGTEGVLYRRGTCARCALREDLTVLMINGAHDPKAMAPIVDALCRVDRPASILTWKRSPKIQALLAGLACGDIPLTHQGLDDVGRHEQTAHLRSLLEHNDILPARDEALARFERWLTQKLDAITEPSVRTAVEQFATWHHLRRLRRTSTPGQQSEAGMRYPNKPSPRRSSSSPGCTTPISAPLPPADNTMSTSGSRPAPPRDQRSATSSPGPRKPASTHRCASPTNSPYLSARSLRNSGWHGRKNFFAASLTHWPTALPESCCFFTPNP
jgi:hypothetical protein